MSSIVDSKAKRVKMCIPCPQCNSAQLLLRHGKPYLGKYGHLSFCHSNTQN